MKLILRKKKKKLLTLHFFKAFSAHMSFYSFYTHINKCNELETIRKCNWTRNSHSLQLKGNSIANIYYFMALRFPYSIDITFYMLCILQVHFHHRFFFFQTGTSSKLIILIINLSIWWIGIVNCIAAKKILFEIAFRN